MGLYVMGSLWQRADTLDYPVAKADQLRARFILPSGPIANFGLEFGALYLRLNNLGFMKNQLSNNSNAGPV